MSTSRSNTGDSVRLALVGAGVIGKKHLARITAEPGAELVAIVDPAPHGAEVAAEHGVPLFADTEAMMSSVNPHGVVVATPTVLHLAPTLAALNAGAHVLVEKPIAATLEQANQIVEASRRTGLNVLVGHQRRYYPLMTRAREIIRDGEIGDLVALNGQWTMRKGESYLAPDWRKKRAAGPVLTNLIHEMDLLRFLCGDIEALSAEVSNATRNFEKEDTAAIAMRFTSGVLGTFLISDATPSPISWELATGENEAFPPTYRNAYWFTGTKGTLEFPGLALWHPAGKAQDWTDPLERRAVPYEGADAYERQCAHFCAVIRGDEAPRINAEDATAALQATLAVLDSADTGQRIAL